MSAARRFGDGGLPFVRFAVVGDALSEVAFQEVTLTASCALPVAVAAAVEVRTTVVLLDFRFLEKENTPEVRQYNPSTPVGDQFQIPLQPHQKYDITQYEELGFSCLTLMKDDYTTNSHYLTLMHLILKGWENVLFELESARKRGRAVDPNHAAPSPSHLPIVHHTASQRETTTLYERKNPFSCSRFKKAEVTLRSSRPKSAS